MMLPQSGHGGASSSGRKANIWREGSETAAPTDVGPEPPVGVPRGAGGTLGPLTPRPEVVATGPGTRLIGTGPPGRAGSLALDVGPAGVSASSFTCTPIALCWSLARNFDASHRKM